jgi:hypothetical protein
VTNASKCCLNVLAALLVTLSTTVARAEGRTDSELTWLLQSDLLGHPTSAPARGPVWERATTRTTGRENLLRFGLSRADLGALREVRTLARLRFEVASVGAEGAPTLRDLSSFVGISWQVAPGARLELRAFPFDTDYLRLGWLHALDWGGTDGARRESVFVEQPGGAPGALVTLRLSRVRWFLGTKWANAAASSDGARLWGVLGGASVDLGDSLRIDSGLGYFQRPTRGLESGRTPSAGQGTDFVEGASLRLVWHRGPSEPELAAEPLRPAPLRAESEIFVAEQTPGASVALELVTLVSRLPRFDDARARVLSAAPAAGLSASLRGRALALHAALTWRSLPFVVKDDARVAADRALPPDAVQQAELAAWLGASFATTFGLVSALELGLELPAALQTPSAIPGYSQSFVVGGIAGFEPLPPGSARLPIVAARASARLPLSASVALAAWLDYQRDPNLTELRASGVSLARSFAAADRLQLTVALQARF